MAFSNIQRRIKQHEDSPVAPRWLVRLIAALTLAFELTIAVLAAVNLTGFGWFVNSLLVLGALGSSYFSLRSLVSGRPEWLLLDLLLPG